MNYQQTFNRNTRGARVAACDGCGEGRQVLRRHGRKWLCWWCAPEQDADAERRLRGPYGVGDGRHVRTPNRLLGASADLVRRLGELGL